MGQECEKMEAARVDYSNKNFVEEKNTSAGILQTSNKFLRQGEREGGKKGSWRRKFDG